MQNLLLPISWDVVVVITLLYVLLSIIVSSPLGSMIVLVMYVASLLFLFYVHRSPLRVARLPDGPLRTSRLPDGPLRTSRLPDGPNRLPNASLYSVFPTDGVVSNVSETESHYVIDVFIRPTDVHVMYAPISGHVQSITSIDRNKMEFVMTTHSRSDVFRIILQGGYVFQTPIALVSVGQHVRRGDRMGFIQFGSHSTLEIPKSALTEPLTIKRGDEVVGGTSVVVWEGKRPTDDQTEPIYWKSAIDDIGSDIAAMKYKANSSYKAELSLVTSGGGFYDNFFYMWWTRVVCCLAFSLHLWK